MALWSLIDSDVIRIIAHIFRLGMEQSLLLDEVNIVAHHVAQTGIDHCVAISAVLAAKGIEDSCANIRINTSALP